MDSYGVLMAGTHTCGDQKLLRDGLDRIWKTVTDEKSCIEPAQVNTTIAAIYQLIQGEQNVVLPSMGTQTVAFALFDSNVTQSCAWQCLVQSNSFGKRA